MLKEEKTKSSDGLITEMHPVIAAAGHIAGDEALELGEGIKSRCDVTATPVCFWD